MKKIFKSLIVCGLVLTFSACSSDEEGPEFTPARSIELSRAEITIVSNQQTFAFNLLNQKLRGSHDNVALSPFSIAMSLSMTANGTEEEMQREILDALQFDDTEDLDVMNTLSKKLLNELPNLDSQTTFISAQSVWTSDRLTLLDDFATKCAESYNATFGNYGTTETGVAEINRWIEQNTTGAIKNALSPVDIDDIAIINATYFKGIWTVPFDKKDTKPKPFTNADGSVNNVPMMYDENHGYYQEDDDMQVAVLPYGNRAFRMVVFLPREGKSLESVLEGMDNEKWLNWNLSFVPCEITLHMPKFGFETKSRLEEDLKALGIRKLWENEATEMTSPAVLMSKFIHNVKIDLDEEGTVAAAASSSIGGDTAVMPGAKVEMNCNHPFAFIIEENSTGVILFIGVVNNL